MSKSVLIKMLKCFHFILGRLGSLGFKIAGGKDKPCVPGDPGIFVQRVIQGSPVYGVLSSGDKILKVPRFTIFGT